MGWSTRGAAVGGGIGDGVSRTVVGALVLLAASCASRPDARAELGPAWEAAGANRAALVLALESAPAAERDDLAYLARQSAWRSFWPTFEGAQVRDAAVVSADLLRSHVGLGHEARRTFPWAAALDDDTFRRYVLAYRMTTERLADWRTPLWSDTELRPLVDAFAERFRAADGDAARDLVFREMLHELNTGWVGRRVPYAPRGMPDLGPLEAVAQGTGRCTDETNTLVAVLRTFGIAATGVRVVAWPEAADNHTWTAVFDPVTGEWLDVDSGQGGAVDDPAYFHRFVRDPAKKVAKVWWVTPGEEEASRARVALRRDEVVPPAVAKYLVAKPVTDRTERYAEVADLVRAGVPSGAMVWLAVWNSGTWRPVAGARADAAGDVTFPRVGCEVRYRLMTWTRDGPAYVSPVLVCHAGGAVEESPADPGDEAALIESAALERMQRGDYRAAKAALLRANAARPGRPDTLYNLACACARLGARTEALDWLERAVAAGWSNVAHVRSDPDLEPLRQDARFRRIVGGE